MCDRTDSGSIKAWPSREPGGWKRQSNGKQNGPGDTQDYVSSTARGERGPVGPDIYQRRSDSGRSNRTAIISEHENKKKKLSDNSCVISYFTAVKRVTLERDE